MDNSYLSELKDIHMPSKPDWWPLSNSLILLLISLLVIFVLTYLLYKILTKKNKIKKEIQQEFIKIKSDFIKTQDKAQLQNNISILLKRITVSSKSKSTNNIFDKNLYNKINIILQTDRFTKNPSIDGDLLIKLSSELIKKCRI